MDPYQRISIGVPNDDFDGVARRLMQVEGLLGALGAHDVTLKTAQGPIEMTVLGREIGLGEEDVITSAFFRLLQKAVAGGTATFLQGGQATGGDGNILVEDAEVIDKDGAALSADGHSLWLKIDGTAVTADGVLMPGINVTAAITESRAAANIPSNVIPTAASPTGTRYVLLGAWADGAFIPSSPGNVQINHCPGSLSITRF